MQEEDGSWLIGNIIWREGFQRFLVVRNFCNRGDMCVELFSNTTMGWMQYKAKGQMVK
jgi:hypothetical protein